MDQPTPGSTRHAILIGINAYPSRALNGCVRDVEDIREFLEAQPTAIHVQSLIAPLNDASQPSAVAQDSDSWPTFQNVTRALRDTTTRAKPGDFVYIHFSGHGTRCEAQGPEEFSHHASGDQGLVLLDNGPRQERVLTGHRLALALGAMVKKGLIVTLALDCCFSGAVYRRDNNAVRFVPHNELSLASEADAEPATRGPRDSEKRNASMLPNWFINPDGYVILTACGPQELAREKTINGGDLHGVFSYHLLQLLKASHLGVKHKDVYHQLRAKFDEEKSQQHPEFYGNQDQPFLGGVMTRTTALPLPIVQRDGLIRLQVGQAHGISAGDQFELAPWGSESRPEVQRERVLAQVKEARALTSDLELLNTTAMGLQTGWNATQHTCGFLHRFPVALAGHLPRLDEWLAALKARSLAACTESVRDSATLYVSRDKTNQYEILDKSSQKLINLPTLPSEIDNVCDILEHLTRYEMVKHLTNETPTPQFSDSFDVVVTTQDGGTYGPGHLIEVHHDEKAKFTCTLQVKNTGAKDIYVSLYNLNSSWAVENISRGGCEVVLPESRDNRKLGVFKKKLKMVLPDEMRDRGFYHCDDIIKVFVTTQPTSFSLLGLPEIGGTFEQKKSTSRVGQEHHPAPEEWAAFNFPIRTSLTSAPE
ncbi:putative caspase [Thelonectria olida]|uniref:Caspase n=1 Tax=Thelonectria olida TaxID=1576542 RepID=A0A9P8W7V5_9HYPO|nr:putative caspase [Thelonectria olida]